MISVLQMLGKLVQYFLVDKLQQPDITPSLFEGVVLGGLLSGIYCILRVC